MECVEYYYYYSMPTDKQALEEATNEIKLAMPLTQVANRARDKLAETHGGEPDDYVFIAIANDRVTDEGLAEIDLIFTSSSKGGEFYSLTYQLGIQWDF